MHYVITKAGTCVDSNESWFDVAFWDSQADFARGDDPRCIESFDVQLRPTRGGSERDNEALLDRIFANWYAANAAAAPPDGRDHSKRFDENADPHGVFASNSGKRIKEKVAPREIREKVELGIGRLKAAKAAELAEKKEKGGR